MSRRGYMLPVMVAGAFSLLTQLAAGRPHAVSPAMAQVVDTPTETPITVPTVVIPAATAVSVPTVAVPQGTAVRVPTITIPRTVARVKHALRRRPVVHRKRARAPRPVGTWIQAYLTSYCPGSAGSISSSGLPVFYGMLANDFYAFGTKVYIPVLGITGIVEDRIGAFTTWNHFDVWSPVCYGTPTGYYKVAVQQR